MAYFPYSGEVPKARLKKAATNCGADVASVKRAHMIPIAKTVRMSLMA
jgi:hypothetical protein